ncbi:MAG: MIP family channel protein [Alphaproteobacteria bacterium]|nr:MIP family channel protein [Alphaproteobacteria bacterium]
MKKYMAELFGTFVLVFIGCGTVVFSAPYVGNIGIALAFGLAVTAMVYAIGPVSGAHINPAVTLGVWSAGRMKFKDVFGYIVFQCLGATLGAALLWYMVQDKINGYDVAAYGLGQNGWGENYGSGYGLISAVIFEFVATFIFVKVILKTTAEDLKIAGVVIGLTLVVLHILGLQITGVSVNPARSLGPALFVWGDAWNQLWMFLVVPSLAGIFAGICSRCCCCCNNSAKACPAEVADAPKKVEAPAKKAVERKPAKTASKSRPASKAKKA